ncbi:MAG: ABC transporter ATP-binding protein [Chitinophagaceae bacterium]|jgi:ABC-type multidrug transport system ATPase subunit|nr:ABC transporter ATP-binding protein [Chitinophagaceae bacterium]
MIISVHNAGKRFNRDWIFRGFNYQFKEDNTYAIVGNNGSGKSTLLQCLSGAMELNEGKLSFSDNTPIENLYRKIAIVAPYLELIEEMTAKEFLHFHASFKPLTDGISIDDLLLRINLSEAAGKQIRFYSSGMKQRLKLAQAIFSKAPILLLDEPCTNLDAAGYELYHHLIKNYTQGKTVIVSSNDKNEYSFCREIIDVRNYK